MTLHLSYNNVNKSNSNFVKLCVIEQTNKFAHKLDSLQFIWYNLKFITAVF